MAKFFMGTALGALLAFVFVRFNWEPPAVLDLPAKLQKNVVATVVEVDLYDLTRDAETRTRALEVYFKTRAGEAAKRDTAAGHPFLNALYRARAAREADILASQWTAYDKALAKPALRTVLERRHGASESDALKRAMLFAALAREPFLKAWLEQNKGPVTADNLREMLDEVRRSDP
jgi:hypothetical protein